MKPVEEELRNALRRREPPPGFAGRVLAKIGAREPDRRGNPWRALFGTPAFRWLVASLAGATLVIGLAVHEERQQRRIQAEKDGRQALLALRITSQKLNEVFDRVATRGPHSAGDPAKSDSELEEP